MSGGSATTPPIRGHLHANVVIGALLMVATLPGRTQGLGLITEPMLDSLGMDRVAYANLNLWASLVGALVCLPAGRLLDRAGMRRVALVLLAGVAFASFGLSFHQGGSALLFFWLFLSRAFGQSGLSVAAIASVAKRGSGKNAGALGLFSVLLSLFFIAAFVGVGAAVESSGWRVAWRGVAVAIALIILPLAMIFLREPGVGGDGETSAAAGGTGFREALRTPLFWIVSGAVAAFAFASSGLGLFNEAVFAEVGQSRETYHRFLAATTGFALAGQFLCGWLGRRVPHPQLLASALAGYAISLVLIAHATGTAILWLAAALTGLSAGFVTVLFFAIWGEAYGSRDLGRIQGVAQGITVLASALGPLLFAAVKESTGSYAPALQGLGAIACCFALASFVVRNPRPGFPDKT